MAALELVIAQDVPRRAEAAWTGGDSTEEDDRRLERTSSEQECDLMIEALRRELEGIKVLAIYSTTLPCKLNSAARMQT